MISLSTVPGPTLGSWFISPTRISLVPIATAFNKAFIRKISTILTSSIISTSASSGLSSFLSKCVPILVEFSLLFGVISSNL